MPKKARKVAFCGSSVFPINAALGSQIVDLLRALEPGTVVLTRGKSNVDEFISTCCLALGIKCFAFTSQGGRDNWQRDVDLARDADELVALLASSTLRASNTGTQHVMEKFLDARKPVRAFTEVGDTLVYAGATE